MLQGKPTAASLHPISCKSKKCSLWETREIILLSRSLFLLCHVVLKNNSTSFNLAKQQLQCPGIWIYKILSFCKLFTYFWPFSDSLVILLINEATSVSMLTLIFNEWHRIHYNMLSQLVYNWFKSRIQNKKSWRTKPCGFSFTVTKFWQLWHSVTRQILMMRPKSLKPGRACLIWRAILYEVMIWSFLLFSQKPSDQRKRKPCS